MFAMNRIEALHNAIYILENCVDTGDVEVSKTLKKLQEMLHKEERNSGGTVTYGNKRKID